MGPGGAADKNKERFASVDNLLKNKCTFYTKNDYARFNEQIKRLRNDYLAKLNKERGADFSWETLPQKDKEGCHKWVYEQAASDPIRPHGFSKKLLSCLVWLVLFDPMHANHNHAKYNFCTTLLVAINFVSFFNSLFPDQTRDRELQETDTSKWGVQKESPSFLKIVQVKNLVNDIIETMESERGLNIQANKTKKTIQKEGKNLTASKFGWRFDGAAFAANLCIIFKIHDLVLKALMAASAEVCQAKLYKNAEVKKEVDATIASYIDVANVLFWDSVFHRSLSRLNSKLTVTEGELQLKALLGFDMIANFNTVGFRVTYNMRVLCTLIVCLLYKWWPILEVETGPSEQPAILGAAATSLQGPPPPPPTYQHNAHVCRC